MAEASSKELTAFGVLKNKDMKVIATRVLIGGINSHRTFQRMTTSVKRVKKGIG